MRGWVFSPAIRMAARSRNYWLDLGFPSRHTAKNADRKTVYSENPRQ